MLTYRAIALRKYEDYKIFNNILSLITYSNILHMFDESWK